MVHQTKYWHVGNQIYFSETDLFGRLFSVKAKKTHTDQSTSQFLFTLSESKELTNIQK